MSTHTKSIWADPTLPRGGSGPPGEEYNVVVVGAGIAGLTAAYHLTRAGKFVLVLDAQPKVAAGETEYTTAHLASVIDDRFSRLKSIRGAAAAKLAYQAHAAAIDDIERLTKDERIDCDFARVDGFLVPHASPDAAKTIDDEEKVARELGVPVVRLDRPPLDTLPVGPALRFAWQGQFHPLNYLAGVAQAITAGGGRISTDCRVEKVEDGTPCRVTLSDGRTVTAASVVVATNTPINNGVMLNAKIAAYHTYAMAVEVPAGSVPRGLIWDTGDPYHYVRLMAAATPAAGSDVLIVGGEDHKTGQATDQADRWNRLEAWTRKTFPAAGAVRARWSGQVFETLDGLALIGRDLGGAENVYIATGDSGMGMTHGTIAGRLLADLILGRGNPYADLFSPTRLPVVSAGSTFLSENANMAAQYTDWVTGGDVASADEVALGCGAVVRRGLTKVAVYRDDDGQLHEMSAVCPHLGGLVHWNGGEGTWDCPCHGSRFTALGKVTHGPAVDDLKPLPVPAPVPAPA